MTRTSSMRWERLVITTGSTSLAKPGSMPLMCMLALPLAQASSIRAMNSGGRICSGHCSSTGPLEVTLIPGSTNEIRSSMHSKTRSSAIAVCTIASGVERDQRVPVVGRLDPSSRSELGQDPGVLALLLGVGHPHPHELQVGVGVDPGDRVPADRAGGPDDDAQRLLGDHL